MSLKVILYYARTNKAIKQIKRADIRIYIYMYIYKKHRLATMLANATHQSTAVLFCKLRVPVSVRAASLMFTVYGIMAVKSVDAT